MTPESPLRIIVQLAVLSSPLLLISIVGLWIAFARRARHPRVSSWAAAGFGLFIVETARSAYVQTIAALGRQQAALDAASEGPEQAAQLAPPELAAMNALGYALSLAAFACLLRAIFVDRPAPAHT